MSSRFLQPPTAEAQIKELELQHDLEDAGEGVYERVVWKRTPTIRPHPLDDVGLADFSQDYPSLRALHTGDPDYWFKRLVDDYSRTARAWVIEIQAVAGDYTVDDPQNRIPDIHGNRADSKLLITQRTVLKEGEDFEYVRELDEEDLPIEPDVDEDDDYGFGEYGEDFDDDDE